MRELNYYETDEEDKVLGWMLSKGAMFISELAKALNMPEANIQALLNKMINKELLVKIVPAQDYPQPLIRARIQDLWDNGVYGFGEFHRRSWFIPTFKAIQPFVEKHWGEHKRIAGAYLMSYPELKMIPPETAAY